MTEKPEPTIKIVVNTRGVKVVQFCGDGWDDEAKTSEIYQLIKAQIQEMDRLLKSTSTGSGVVQ